ncbi:MAG: DNA-3-methyladenine glycosylase 2 family protein [Myxococcaceae bacterium]|jgi:DNA-3-methyladenine glycosylase II|nr:DNA-3-methyladenine glycosylase 2 family protein [Myxococcaceae bacterium]
MSRAGFGAQLRAAEAAVVRADRRFARIVERAGPCRLERATHFRPFEALLTSITHQQLSGKAAETILGRVKERLAGGRFPTPEQVRAARMPVLRACGLSGNKALALKDLAAKTLDGTVPTARELHRLDDDAIVERLTTVRGVGRWTVEMMLMFRLGRLDVMPADDLGVRKGFSVLAKLDGVIAPKALLHEAERWRPWRTVAAWYCWRVLDV